MGLVRITLKDGKKYFITESSWDKGVTLVDSIDKAFNYEGTLEFKVTWKLTDIPREKPNGYGPRLFEKSDVVKFEYIDKHTVEIKEFDVNEVELEIGDEIYVDSATFRKLIICGIGSSHFVDDKNGEWIGFPKKEDFDRVGKIRYYARGLTYTITAYHSGYNWFERYKDKAWHWYLEPHHDLMLNPIIQQIALLKLDSCKRINVYEKKVY